MGDDNKYDRLEAPPPPLKSGIYCILNVINNKIYIGSAVNIEYRFARHKRLLKAQNHFNKYLQNAWNKDGENSFKLQILEKCLKEKLPEKEQYYIDILNPDYNIVKNVLHPMLGRKQSIKWHENMEKLRAENHPFKGKRHSKESIEKIKKNMPDFCGSNNPMYGISINNGEANPSVKLTLYI